MADHGQRRESERSPRRSFAGLLDGRVAAVYRLLARRGEAEVFPWLEQTTVVAALVGASGCLGLGLLFAVEPHRLALFAILGATLGALAGIALAVTWAIEQSAVAAAAPAEPVDLWDPWLDRGDEADDAVADADPALVIPEERVIVRPRVRSPETGESVPLEDVLGTILAEHERGAVRLSGPPGSGKSTALTYLAGRVPAHFGATFRDEADLIDVTEAAVRGWVVFAVPEDRAAPTFLSELQLAPWGRDEWIEYLLARDRDRCASVIARLAGCPEEIAPLEGLPELWQVVLDRMAEDESVGGPRDALRVEVGRRLADREQRELVAGDCLTALLLRKEQGDRLGRQLCRHNPDEAAFRLIRHRAVHLLLAADRLAGDLARRHSVKALFGPLPQDLVREAAPRIAGLPDAVSCLKRVVADPEEKARQPMAASLLHALRQGWKPDRPAPCLTGAYLEGADWGGVDLGGADLRQADLGLANLWYARLDRANLAGARLAGADLRSASLEAAQLAGADLSGARLAKVQARRAHFGSASLAGAHLSGADLDHATFWRADLSGARLAGCRLVGASLLDANLDGTDLRKADLHKADLKGLDFTGVRLEGAVFRGADLSRCNLEGVTLTGADFAESNLAGALLTGSQMRGADFRGACLRGAGVAGVDWPGADLRKADLREAAFHLGSSRSGLVDSPVACEGSRTGFYTDDFSDQDFKSPEEIRKANLREADLRGAKIEGVDFYLVDLRGARVDPEHVPHLRRCGAILESRA